MEKILRQISPIRITGSSQRYISGVQYDSRKIKAGEAFVAIRGLSTDGHHYIEQAVTNGAEVFFVEREVKIAKSTVIVLENTRKDLAKIGRVFFNYPDKKLKIIGITGTNGKTTTAYILFSILKEAHWNPGLISTIEYYDGTNWITAERTTPESLDIFALFSGMHSSGLKSVVMEVSSHSLVLHRVEGIKFEGAVFTNLSRDHLDFHQTQENYFLAKLKLFEDMKEDQKVILNQDDPFSERIKKMTAGEVFTYSLYHKSSTVYCQEYLLRPGSSFFRLKIPSGEIEFECHLLGEHNIYNMMAAITTAVSLGITDSFIRSGIQNLPVIPGRNEYYVTPSAFSIYLDYAHTPEGIRKLLLSVWETKPANLIVVFGAGGDRDKGKRSEMGKEADDYADQIILSNDNPRSENPLDILEDIKSGITNANKITIITNRQAAIYEALNRAKKGDAVVIAGKGHEQFQEIAGKKFYFSDRAVIQKFFSEKGWDWQKPVDLIGKF